MKPFTTSLIFKIGAIIILVESVVLFAFGFFYIRSFSMEIEKRIERQVQLPGILMNRQLLKYESVGNKEVMTELVGEAFVDGLVVDTDGKVFYALDPLQLGRDIRQFGWIDPSEIGPDVTKPVITRRPGAAGHDLVSITPLVAYEGAKPFFFACIRVTTQMSERARGEIFRLFVFGSVCCLVLTSAVMIWFVREVVTKPVGRLEESANRVTCGDLEHTIETGRTDELGSLARSFSGMQAAIRGQIAKLEAAGRTLEATVAERTCDLNENMARLREEVVERKTAEAALRESEKRLRILFDYAPDAYYLNDAEGKIIEGNRAAEKLFGCRNSELAGMRMASLNLPTGGELAGPDGGDVSGGRASHFPGPKEVIVRRRDGALICTEISSFPIRIDGEAVYLGIARDITERKKAEEFMIQSEKMVSVGGLAAGMAHEINNPLAGILQNLQVLRGRLMEDMPANRRSAEKCGITIAGISAYMEERRLPEMLDLIMESGRRAARVVENMLSFSRKGGSTMMPASLMEILDRTVELSENDYDLKKNYDFRKIEIGREYQAGMPEVPCEATMMQQVILNLLRNAAQALTGRANPLPPPRITLRIRRDGTMARIEIEDNGPGMTEAVRRRVFEPFYTTKGVEVGTGLGLSVSYFIVTESHGGTMRVESAAGGGSRFVIHIPLQQIRR